MKRAIIGGLLAAGTLLGGLAFTTTVSADEHHPVCAGLVKDIEPGVPTPIDGIVYVKAGTDHYNVGYQDAGYVAGPQGSQPYDVSHVDVCPTPTKDDEVTYGDWTGAPKCDEKEYVQTRTKTTVSYVWDGAKFVAQPPVMTEERRTVQVENPEPCPTTPTTPPTTPTTPPTTPTTPPTTPTPTTPTPTTPTPTTPTGQVASQSPPPATPQAAAPTAAAPAATLPSTGLDSTGITALLALLVTSLGGAAMMVARRRGVTS